MVRIWLKFKLTTLRIWLSNKKYKIKKGLWKNSNLWKLYEKAQTPFKWHKDAFKIAKKHNIELFSTPFSIRAFHFLKKHNPNLYKISSFEITDFNLINRSCQNPKTDNNFYWPFDNK